MTDVSWLGVWLLVLGVVIIVLEGTLAALWSVRIAKRSRVLSERLASEEAQLRADSERLQASLAEMQVLWQPYRRLLGWLRHPIAIALLQSYARRRVATR
jgi:hypothetical protein